MVTGFEPATLGFANPCSAIELYHQLISRPELNRNLQGRPVMLTLHHERWGHYPESNRELVDPNHECYHYNIAPYSLPGSNRGSLPCKGSVLTTRPRELVAVLGIEPRTQAHETRVITISLYCFGGEPRSLTLPMIAFLSNPHTVLSPCPHLESNRDQPCTKGSFYH